MSSRAGLAALALAMAVSLPATAQIEESGLDLVNPWGMGFLEAGEPSLPTGMWEASDAEFLLPMMRKVRTIGLTPAERSLMRRMALSPANPPAGETEPLLRAERARIMFELGEAQAAAELMARLDETPLGMNAHELSADLNLALGNEATACGMLEDPEFNGDYWAKLRAVCAALAGNTAGAELAMELALSQGVEDSWLLNAVFAASGEMPDPPEARYDSGLALAISSKAGLPPPSQPLSIRRPDLAAAIARHPDVPPVLRARAAGLAAEAGLIGTDAHRQAFEALLDDPDFEPSTSLEIAISAARDPEKTPAERAHALAIALRTAMGDPAGFAATAGLLGPDIAALPPDPVSARDALTLARAALAAGQPGLAGGWATRGAVEDEEDADLFDFALMDGWIILSGHEPALASAAEIGNLLAEEAKTPGQKQAVIRLMTLWSVFGIAPPARARALMLDQGAALPDGERLGALMSMLAAAEAGAAGEVILSAVGLTNGDPGTLRPAELVLLIEALKRIGAEDEARALALEATGYWKRPD